jgi:hypothetical protein
MIDPRGNGSRLEAFKRAATYAPLPAPFYVGRRLPTRLPRRPVFQDFVDELADLGTELGQQRITRAGGPIVFPYLAAHDFLRRDKYAAVLERVQQRIHRPGSDVVAVALELLHHFHAEDAFLGSVMQHMDADEREKHIAHDLPADETGHAPVLPDSTSRARGAGPAMHCATPGIISARRPVPT